VHTKDAFVSSEGCVRAATGSKANRRTLAARDQIDARSRRARLVHSCYTHGIETYGTNAGSGAAPDAGLDQVDGDVVIATSGSGYTVNGDQYSLND
jgi:hypothetical protein